MQDNYVLIDYENVQPQNIDILSKHPFKVFVFLGASQTKIPVALVEAMRSLGMNVHYIQMTGNGKNALDFHLAYYLGELVTKSKKSHFYIISKDTGFDPLIKHLQDQNVQVYRVKDLAKILVLQTSGSNENEERISVIVKNLESRQSRPRKTKTLKNSIKALFKEQIPESELMALINLLEMRKYISVKDENVSYTLPDPPK